MDGTRSCVYCFGHGHTLAQDGARVQCPPCAGKGRARCPTCKGEAFVRGY
jgi:DnaJ-class molecular chaperone